MPKKLKVAIYTRKTFLLKIEEEVFGLKQSEKMHSVEKLLKRGLLWSPFGFPLLLQTKFTDFAKIDKIL